MDDDTFQIACLGECHRIRLLIKLDLVRITTRKAEKESRKDKGGWLTTTPLSRGKQILFS